MHVRNKGLKIYHLIFANDVILFAKGSLSSLNGMNQLLSLFGSLTGQLINFQKSQVIFSRLATASFEHLVCQTQSLKNQTINPCILAFQCCQGKKEERIFSFLVNRFRKKVEGWQAKIFSNAGKMVMIKSTLQSLPIHLMSCSNFHKLLLNNSLKPSQDFGGMLTMIIKKLIWQLGWWIRFQGPYYLI